MVISGQTNYEGQNLSFQDFSEQTLTNANFKDANLNSADFSGATLTGADFSGANLDGASFENAVITGVNFSNTNVASAYFGGVTSGGITGTPSSINNYKLIGGYIVGAAAGTGDVKLSDTVFEGTASELLDFTNTTFQDGDLTGVQFTHIDFTGANFTNTNLTNTVFTNVTFSGIISGGITGTPSALPDAYKIVSGYILAPQSNLMTANLAGADLSNMDLSGANFRYGSLTGANLSNTNLTGANLSNTTMTGIIGTPQALPSGYQLIDGSIVLSTSDTAVVEEIFNQITSRTTVPSDLKGTTVTFNPASKILPTKDTKYATRPDTVTVTVSKGSETETKTFSETVSADLTDANLTGFNFTGIDLTGAIFSGATLNGADFTNANVTNASFTSATLTGATFTGTTMTGADLTSAILREVISGTITGTPTLPTGYNLVKETIIGTAVNLTNADLSGQDLTGIDLTDATLTKANLENATLINATLTNATLTGATLTGATLTGLKSGNIQGTPASLPTDYKLALETIVGPNVDLTDGDLTNENLMKMNLTGVNFTNADLTGVNFILADLTDATLTRATLTGADGPVRIGTYYPLYFTQADAIKSSSTSSSHMHTLLGYDFYMPDPHKTFTNDDWKTDLQYAYLEGANFSGLDLTGVNFTGANLNSANITGATLTGATLTGAKMTGIVGTPQALPDGYEMLDQAIVLTSNITADVNIILSQINSRTLPSDLRGTSVTFDPESKKVPSAGTKYATETYTVTVTVSKGSVSKTTTFQETVSANLTGADLTGFDFTNVNLTDANFTNVNFTNATFTGATLTNANFTGATFTGVISGNIQGTPQTLPTNYKVVKGYLIGPGVNLTGATLTGANLSNVNLTGATLTGANLTGEDLTDFDFTGVNLTGANFTNATLTNVTLTNVTLTNANLTDATLNGVKSGGIHGTPQTLPTNYKVVKGYIVGPGVNLSGADLTGATLGNVDLSNADLSNANFKNATLYKTNLSNANLEGATLDNVNLVGATLTNANFTGVTLTGVKSGGINSTPQKLPSNYTIIKGYIIGRKVDLTSANLKGADLTGVDVSGSYLMNANLTDADLSGANLKGVNLRNANLTGATLTGVKSGGIQGTPQTLPTNYEVLKGYLIGPGVNLTGANLKGEGLTSANLTNANLTDANLSGAYFTIATNIEGANLTNANLMDANFPFLLKSGGIIGTPQSLPTNYKLVGGYIIGATVDLRNADLNLLKGADLEDMNLRAILLPENFNLENANLKNAQLTGRLNKVNLTNANLTNAKLNGNKQDSIQMQFPDGDISSLINDLLQTELSLQYVYQQQVSYHSIANLSGANLTGAILTAANLTDATMTDIVGTPQALPYGYEMLDQAIVLTSNLRVDVNAVYNEINIKIRSPNFPNDRTLPSDLRGTTVTFDPAEKVPSAETKYATETYTVTITVSKGSVRKETTYRETLTANLTGKDLTGFDFSGANLTGVNFTNANLTGANFTNANFTGATLTGVKSGGIIGTPQTLPPNYTLVKGYVVGPGVNLTGANLTGFDFSGVNLTDATFTGATLTNANLTDATLNGVKSGGIQGTPQTLPTNYKIVNGYIIGPGVNLTDADLTDFDFSGVNLTDANFTDATLNGVISGGIQGTPQTLPTNYKIVNGYIVGPRVNLSGADLTGFDFSGVNLTYAIFTNATLTNVNLSGADLNSFNFDDANVTYATFRGVISGGIQGTPQTLPTNYKIVNGYIVGPGVILTGANLSNGYLSNADLSNADLSNADLSNTDFYNTNLKGANLGGVNLSGANLKGEGLRISSDVRSARFMDLTDMDLTDANLTNADLSYVDLTNATLTNATLTNVRLGGVKSGDIIGTPRNLTIYTIIVTGYQSQVYKVVNGYLIGPYVNLSGVDFTNVNLSGAYLTGVDLSGANLTDANLKNADLEYANIEGANLTNANLTDANFFFLKSGGIIGTPTLSNNYKLVGGYIIGATVDLRNADLNLLKGADLEDMNLRSILLPENFNLEGANLENAQLTGVLNKVNLKNANLKNAKLNGNLTDYRIIVLESLGSLAASLLKESLDPPDGVAFIFQFIALLGTVKLRLLLINNMLSTNNRYQELLQESLLRNNSADLSGADLSGADLREAILDGVKGESVIGLPNLPSHYRIINGRLIGPNTDLSGLDLTNADFSGFNLSNKNLSGANLSGANLSGANLTSTNLSGANLTSANLSGANLTSANLSGANLSGANLDRVKSKGVIGLPNLSSNYRIINGVITTPNGDLSGLDLTNEDLSGLDLTNADLSGTILTNTDLSGTILTNAIFTNVKSKNITFNAQNPPTLSSNVKLVNGILFAPGVNLTGSNLTGFNLTDVDFTGVTTKNITFDEQNPPTLPPKYKVVVISFSVGEGKCIIGPGVNMSGLTFLKTNLSNMDLTNTNFEGAHLYYGENFTNANLTNANFKGAHLRSMNFNGANLTNANFNGAYLINVKFNGAEGANFTNAAYFTDDGKRGLSGKAIDGYVSFASGGLFDINDTTNAIETFITDENGNYDLFTPISELPEVYVIIIQPGGTDITTGKIVTTTMSSTSTRKQAEASAVPILHVTPVTTIVTNITQTINTVNKAIGETTDETTVSSAMEQVAKKLNISEESIRSDFIADQNSDVVKIVQQIETTVNSMTSALNNTEITGDVVTNNISLTFMESDTTFDFSNSNDINKIITNIENSNTIVDDALTFIESDTTNEDINIIANTLEDGAETITIDESVKSNTSNFITVANTLISDIDTATQTFDDVFTLATQITVASTDIATTNGENFTSPVEAPTISEITSVPITIPAPSFITNICFPGNTPIETDDGYITIKKLVPGHHTIRGQRIVGITKTIAPDEHLICFEKDALGKNVPSQRTLMSKEHKIYYKNKLQEARDFLEDFDLVSKSKYSGEPLYNVLLEYHGIMIVNNMPCETLHPKSLSAKLYTSIRYSSSVREQILAMIHRAIQNKDYKTYRKIMKRI